MSIKIEHADWNASAFRWHSPNTLEPISNLDQINLEDLLFIERKKQKLISNTLQFINGLPCNHALLSGARGIGKSSLIKAVLKKFQFGNLKLIEVDKAELKDWPYFSKLISGRAERFIAYCDDLSFERDDSSYKLLKTLLDGTVYTIPSNMIIYTTSNRRHLMPEYLEQNRKSTFVDGEIHLSETIEEALSLSDRFGIWLSFQPFSQDEYLAIVAHWIEKLDKKMPTKDFYNDALKWALQRSSGSGRTAYQFAKDFIGSRLVQKQ